MSTASRDYKQFKDYQLIKLRFALQENEYNSECDRLKPYLENELELLNAEIQKRGIHLTKTLVKRWWHTYNKGIEGRMQWKQPSGYNHWWEKGTVAVYEFGAAATAYRSLEAIVSDIGERGGDE
jgi:hypothetical protein